MLAPRLSPLPRSGSCSWRTLNKRLTVRL
jgi:hypothetical protein